MMLAFRQIGALLLATTLSLPCWADTLRLETNMGNIDIELFRDKAPVSTDNFIRYAKNNFYDGTIFHRVIPGFMIQGGGFDQNMQQKEAGAPIRNEADNGLENLRGTLAMARRSDKDSATSQFFINVKDNHFLDHGVRDFGYAVFGKVVAGMDIVDKIAAVPTGRRGMFSDVPESAVIIKHVTVLPQ
nr:peptidylprolyl isomerase [Pokkaliibacter plantistimulans]